MSNNIISQAAVMQTNGVPNDVITNLNPLSLVIVIPLLDKTFYPLLRRLRFNFTPIKRITAGYFISAAAMVWTAVVQHYIYERGECGMYPSGKIPGTEKKCPDAPLSVWIQSGSYVLTAFAEIFASITSLEYAHSKAPRNMRSMVQAVGLFMNAISSGMGFLLVSLSEVGDPLPSGLQRRCYALTLSFLGPAPGLELLRRRRPLLRLGSCLLVQLPRARRRGGPPEHASGWAV